MQGKYYNETNAILASFGNVIGEQRNGQRLIPCTGPSFPQRGFEVYDLFFLNAPDGEQRVITLERDTQYSREQIAQMIKDAGGEVANG